MTKQEKLSKISNNLEIAIAEEKAKRAAAESEFYANVHRLRKGAQEMMEAVTSEPDEQPDNDQPTAWLDGTQSSCVAVARRVLGKLPKLNYTKESIYIEISPSHHGGCGLDLRYINIIDKVRGVTSCELVAAKDTPEEQAKKVDLWLKDVEVQMARAQEIMREEADNE